VEDRAVRWFAMRRVLVASLLSAFAAVTVLVTGQACSSFGASSDGDVDSAARDGATPGDGAADAPPPDPPPPDAASCQAPVTLLTFDSDPFPPDGFTVDVVDGGTLVRSPNAGVGGSGALQSDLLVPATSGGPTAKIYQQLKVAPAEIELSYDFTAPAAPGLFVQAGCELSFHTASDDQVRTKLSTITYDSKGPLVYAASFGPDAAAPVELAAVPAPAGLFHHVTLRVVIDPAGTSAQAHSVLDGVAKDFGFPLIVVPSAVTMNCGAYADSASTRLTVLVDNVRFAICRTRP
jgi:hypothetical protein